MRHLNTDFLDCLPILNKRELILAKLGSGAEMNGSRSYLGKGLGLSERIN